MPPVVWKRRWAGGSKTIHADSDCLGLNSGSDLWEEERKSMTEPTHHLIHRIMSSSSYNEEDLTSFSSDNEEDQMPDPSAKITEDSFEFFTPENPSSIKFTTLFQRDSILASTSSSKDGTSDSGKRVNSKRKLKMMKKVSSTLSKVFPRSDANKPKTSSSYPSSRTDTATSDVNKPADLP
ncbi:fibrous sheath-interacting protein 2-like [Trichechus manatus latirostris]|uniref:Fibrous sheath-interacting protein 2-like n=1 Tax=Trichechus manatus latirostris TaxID=127582 RepID=A0A2Y9RDN5_TRIMA|nr:fibrous sheath-interacting protein 2-like [Trichechus manatus latirostris]